MTHLVLIQQDGYDRDLLERHLQAAFDQLDLSSVIESGENILIKPNMLAAVHPDKAVTPHPQVFAALAACLRRLDVNLSYGDSPAIDTPERAARICGFAEAAASMQIPMANFSQADPVTVSEAEAYRQMYLARGVSAADGLVSLAKLKTHALTGMTGVLKNQFGVISGIAKAKLHVQFPNLEDFARLLTDINRHVRPRFAVMDAIISMEGNGPKNGHPRQTGWLLVSTDLVAIDTAAALLIGLDPRTLPFIRIAAAGGLGECRPDQIHVTLIRQQGDSIISSEHPLPEIADRLGVKDFKQAETRHSTLSRATRMAPLLKRFVLSRPVIDPDICTRCGLCETVCPLDPKAVRQIKARTVPVYQYSRCIRCYCCQETCPAGAITVRRTLIGRWFRT
ncbi:MAG: DUF362 domain-containing protein [Eubacteriales bacterium]|nr:DUF362 domain-containing protein [Eubacteriales bacterium]